MSDLRFAYGTNGLTDHRLPEALELLAETGYDGVSLTLDHGHLDPLAPDLPRRTAEVARELDRLGLAVVVETGARFVLDPRRKHEPTLLHDDGRDRRLALLRTAVEVGADLGAEAVHLWSGRRPPAVPSEVAWDRLRTGCTTLLEHADARGVTLAFEPEPGMLVADLAAWAALADALGDHPRFGMTLDVGHVLCGEPPPVVAHVAAVAPHVRHVQIEDARRDVHVHLPFGEGELDLPPVLGALRQAGYAGLVSVELTRNSHDAHVQVPAALAALRDALRDAPRRPVPT